ncbi:hypothetical protein EJ110_NYTH28899, partial [Nymphaea thermarum]
GAKYCHSRILRDLNDKLRLIFGLISAGSGKPAAVASTVLNQLTTDKINAGGSKKRIMEKNRLVLHIHDKEVSFLCFFPVFLSIDCGETGNHLDRFGINWVGDDGYIKTGKATQVRNSGIYAPELNSLRYFPSQKKSCYVIRGVNRGRKHMVRAHFFYGNYDGKSSPPSFNLQFDGNHWASVTTSSSISYNWEVIYAPKRDNISVCVAQTSPDQIPFISALKIREFELGMYETVDREVLLLNPRRRAFGTKDGVR